MTDELKIYVVGKCGVGKSTIAYEIQQYLIDIGFIANLIDDEILTYEEFVHESRMKELAYKIEITVETKQLSRTANETL